jgi:hypothetical protein
MHSVSLKWELLGILRSQGLNPRSEVSHSDPPGVYDLEKATIFLLEPLGLRLPGPEESPNLNVKTFLYLVLGPQVIPVSQIYLKPYYQNKYHRRIP